MLKKKMKLQKKVNNGNITTNELPNTSKNNTTSHVNINTVGSKEKNRNKKVPPINIIDIESNQLIEFIKNGLKIKEFKIKEFRNKKSLFMNTLDDFLKVRAYLEKTNAKFFTFTPKGIKTKTYLLKGLDSNLSTDEILNELCQFQCDDLKFIKVTQFATKN